MRLTGKTAVVTGAASGINRAIALAFADEGATVICADRDGDAAASTARAIQHAGGVGHAVACDVTRQDDIDAVIDFASRTSGGLDILVNGAGIMSAQQLLEVTRDSFQAVFDVNVAGLFFMLQAAARAMIAGGRPGRIINLASIAGRQGNAGSLQYSASKAAVISITQSAGRALAPHGIAVNAIAPGFVQTNMWKEIQEMYVASSPGETAENFDAMLASTVAVGRLGLPSDILATALFLADGNAQYIVGQTINVDGGVFFS